MKLVQIKTSKAHRRGLEINTSSGKIFFNNELIAEINAEKVKELMSNDSSLTLVDEDDLEIVEKSSIPTTELLKQGEEIVALRKKISKLEIVISEKDEEILELKKLSQRDLKEIESLKKDLESKKGSNEGNSEIRQNLDEMNVDQLKDTLKEAGIPETEWKNLKKPALIDLIIKNLK